MKIKAKVKKIHLWILKQYVQNEQISSKIINAEIQ